MAVLRLEDFDLTILEALRASLKQVERSLDLSLGSDWNGLHEYFTSEIMDDHRAIINSVSSVQYAAGNRFWLFVISKALLLAAFPRMYGLVRHRVMLRGNIVDLLLFLLERSLDLVRQVERPTSEIIVDYRMNLTSGGILLDSYLPRKNRNRAMHVDYYNSSSYVTVIPLHDFLPRREGEG